MISAKDFFDLKDFEHHAVFPKDEPVWAALNGLHHYLTTFFQKPWPLAGIRGQMDTPLIIYRGKLMKNIEVKPSGPDAELKAFSGDKILEDAAIIMPGAFLFDDRILIGPGSIVEPGALIKGPTIIGERSEVRQGAYIRGDCLVGDNCVVGHATEMKASIMLNGAQAGHFAYIGDSILGNKVNLGAGTKLANLKMIPGKIVVTSGNESHNTGRRKLGAILGDRTETGCNSVISPGTLLSPRSIVYPCVAVPGKHYPTRTTFSPQKDSLIIRSYP